MTAVEKLNSEPDAYMKRAVNVSLGLAVLFMVGGSSFLFLANEHRAAAAWTLAWATAFMVVWVTISTLANHQRKLREQANNTAPTG